MYKDAFGSKDCSVENKTYAHGSELCGSSGSDCKVCIDGWWIDKLSGRGPRGY